MHETMNRHAVQLDKMNETRPIFDLIQINRINSFYFIFFFCSALLEFMTAPNDCLQRRVYNVTAMSFTPEELVDKIHKYVPELRVTYKPDSRQNIGIFKSALKMFQDIFIYLFLDCIY